MEHQNPLNQLASKRRYVDDLCRFIGSRAVDSPAYTFLLGAGCSVSSGVRSASNLVELWREDIFKRLFPGEVYDQQSAAETLSKRCSSWYNQGREYASLFEKNFDLPRQRRIFVENEVSGKVPNLGYAYLVRLMESGYSNAVFTTNFDDLINEAFFQYSRVRPIVCAHDSSIGSVTLTSKRPKIIKLHGDYLFDDIKSTIRETESLEENIKKKFIEFGREYGLIVVGYSGCDRSVMDVLQHLLRSDEYFKHGIYWCLRKGDHPSDELVKLLWKDRVYFVEIEGFDELFAEIYSGLIGDSLPVDTGFISDKPEQIIRGFCENTYLNQSNSPVIKRDLERLRKQNEREQLLNVVRRLDDSDGISDANSKQKLSDSDLARILEIRQLMSISDIQGARDKIRSALSGEPSQALKDELSDLRITVEELTGEPGAAVRAVDDLISEDPKNPENYIRKSHLIGNHEDRLAALSLAEDIDPYYAEIYNRKAECLIEAYRASIGFDSVNTFKEIESCINKSIAIDSSVRNGIWLIAINFYRHYARMTKDSYKEKLDSIVRDLNQRNLYSITTYFSRLARLSKYAEDRGSGAADHLLSDISDLYQRKGKSYRFAIAWLELDALFDLHRKEKLSEKIGSLSLDPDFSEKHEFLRRKAEFLIQFNGDIYSAIEVMSRVVSATKKKVHIFRLAAMMCYVKNHAGIADLIHKYSSGLRAHDKALLQRELALASGDIDKALALLRSSYQDRVLSVSHISQESHDLLLLKRYEQAESMLKDALDRLSWSKESGDLIINYELACYRRTGSLRKSRLSELADATSDEMVKACAKYLLGDLAAARDIFKAEIIRDRGNLFLIRDWAIWADEKGRRFIDSVEKLV